MRLTRGQGRIVREMKARGRALYIKRKLQQLGEVVAMIAGTALFIAVLYSLMIVFPD